VPILLKLLKTQKDIIDIIEGFEEDEPLLVEMDDGRQLALPPDRTRTLLKVISSLFTFHGTLSDEEMLRLQVRDAALLAEIESAAESLNLRWFGGERLRQIGNRLKTITTINHIPVPKSFQGELRSYQQDGLNWLQFLREFGLAGILADDMGLGKTVQVLSHIAVEKEAGRLTKPFLVIAPTSLMVNWRIEAERFLPDLKVLTLHGDARKAHFKDIAQYDLVLTTYPLLPRDKAALVACDFHSIILDEAQTIKNARAKITQIVNQLKATHRLCMTGTPLENHLGELWSLFNFILPGYLGKEDQFRSLFRYPIERDGNMVQAETLAKRVKPFMLRRTKQEVVTELPPKTEIVRMIELEGGQRDLYEVIRISMHDRVRQEIALKGVEKSHIIVLDALLKLRQVCCDPSLLKTVETAKKVKESAKLDELMDFLPSMLEEGRKVLLFSQFTSMLEIIEQQLTSKGIEYVKITGDTKDRETPVRRFQGGEVSLFLISLKAGGTGLNLTAADTVIHYDPWWNPAVEDQATDRAYRIGQDKPVFVYKLITSGTVEEKILDMQSTKRQRANILFDSNRSSSAFSVDDIQALFEPLSTETKKEKSAA
jgi:SNF2 family DNA or RNA helicase